MNTELFKNDLPEFREKTADFYAGRLDKNVYKGFSGYYGSYAQKGGEKGMLRLRMTAGRVTKEKLAFVADVIRRYGVKRAHFTTCQSIQLHDLDGMTIGAIMEEALDKDIVTIGGGGDFPRNVMCSPLSGVEADEYFNVQPWAEAAAAYLMGFIKAEKMPRKLKVCFSSGPRNVTHATYRDLGFAARPDGCFDVYSAGGLGNHPLMGVLVAEKVQPEDILYYIKAMWLTFRSYGNYENRGKARTRYMQEVCGGPEGYRAAYLEKLQEAFKEDLKISVQGQPVVKAGDGTEACGKGILPQKQKGLYTVVWHPIGGQPDLETLCAVSDAAAGMEAAEMRLAPDETAYIVNLTGSEATKLLELIQKDSAQTLFETSVSCIGAATCQVGLCDSQALLAACIEAVRKAAIKDGALPQIHISGCPSSCGTHQTGAIGFRGASKRVDGKAETAFVLTVNGCEVQGREMMGREVGTIIAKDIPAFLVKLGNAVQDSGMDYAAWAEACPQAIDDIAAEYIA